MTFLAGQSPSQAPFYPRSGSLIALTAFSNVDDGWHGFSKRNASDAATTSAPRRSVARSAGRCPRSKDVHAASGRCFGDVGARVTFIVVTDSAMKAGNRSRIPEVGNVQIKVSGAAPDVRDGAPDVRDGAPDLRRGAPDVRRARTVVRRAGTDLRPGGSAMVGLCPECGRRAGGDSRAVGCVPP